MKKITVREVTGEDVEVTKRDVLQKLFETALEIARNDRKRGYWSGVKHSFIGVSNWLAEGYNRWQLRTGRAKAFRSPTYGWTDDCQRLPDDWRVVIDEAISKLNAIFWKHLEKADFGNPKPEGFWAEWHADWEAEVIPQIIALAKEYRCEVE